jgi:hypothetical protein
MKKIEGITGDQKKAIIGILEYTNPRMQTLIGDIRMIDKICTAIENAKGDAIELEDADYAYMKQRLAGSPAWIPSKRKEIIALADKLGL